MITHRPFLHWLMGLLICSMAFRPNMAAQTTDRIFMVYDVLPTCEIVGSHITLGTGTLQEAEQDYRDATGRADAKVIFYQHLKTKSGAETYFTRRMSVAQIDANYPLYAVTESTPLWVYASAYQVTADRGNGLDHCKAIVSVPSPSSVPPAAPPPPPPSTASTTVVEAHLDTGFDAA